MAANVSVIGRTTRIRGRVSGAGDLEVQGFVDGEVAVGGDVTVDTHGMVGAGVAGRRLVVRGAVKGDLQGGESILLEDGARVVGDVRAPRVVIAPGALVRGFVDTGDGAGAPTTARPHAQARPAPAPARVAAPAVKHEPAAPVAKAAAPVTKAAAPSAHAASGNHAPASPGAPRRPPPPVVPALKKAKGQIAKKKER